MASDGGGGEEGWVGGVGLCEGERGGGDVWGLYCVSGRRLLWRGWIRGEGDVMD